MSNPRTQIVDLSAFGRLCHSLSGAIARKRIDFASARQREAFAAATEAFDFMAAAGAPTGSYRYVILDDRKLGGWLDKALARAGYGPDEKIPDNGSSASNWSTWSTGGKREPGEPAWICKKSRGQALPWADPDFVSHFGDARLTHIFNAAHEFGHAWQAQEGARHVFSAAVAAAENGHPFGERMRHLLTPILGDTPLHIREASQRAPEIQWMTLVEESCSDMFGAWALSLAGCCDGISRVASFRRSQIGKSPIFYSTFHFLDALAERHEVLPASFDDFVSAMEGIIFDPIIARGSMDAILDQPAPQSRLDVKAAP